jgi:CRP-like cAMP-binding protein
VRRFGAGDLLGATSMLDGIGATGTAVALTDVEALVAGPADFRALEADPQIEARLESASRSVLRSELLALSAA